MRVAEANGCGGEEFPVHKLRVWLHETPYEGIASIMALNVFVRVFERGDLRP